MDSHCTSGYPVGRRLSGKYEGTFGAVTLKKRLPIVLTQIIDTLHRYNPTIVAKHGEEGTKQVKSSLAKLAEFRYRLLTDKVLTLILTGPDTKEWTDVFEVYRKKFGHEPHPFGVSWLFVECYMYRKVMEIIMDEPLLFEYDPFQAQKEQSLNDSIDSIKTVAGKLTDFMKMKPAVNKEIFDEYIMLSLWGNKADLSMAATMDSYEMSHQSQSMDHLRKYILADHSQQVWELMTSSQTREEIREVAIVLDNSGFELFSDLVLAEWLLSADLCDRVYLYCKIFPWFISDATRRDINWTLEQLSASEDKLLANLGEHWSRRLREGSIIIKEHYYWTTSYEYSTMKEICPDLYTALSSVKLAIFKGDLNYRKLLADRNWPYTESFSVALQNFRPTNILALRTLKADLVVGLPEGAAAWAAMETTDWMIKGMFAVLQVALVET